MITCQGIPAVIHNSTEMFPHIHNSYKFDFDLSVSLMIFEARLCITAPCEHDNMSRIALSLLLYGDFPHIRISDNLYVDLFVTVLPLTPDYASTHLVEEIANDCIASQPRGDFLHIKISDKFDVDLCITILTYETRSQS